MAKTTTYASSSSSSSSQRSLAMVLALVSAVVLSPLYGNSRSDRRYYESKWSSAGFLLPMFLVGLIIAIRTTSSSVSSSSSSSSTSTARASFLPSPEPSWVFRIGSSSWGLGGILVMLVLLLHCQTSVQEFFWR